MSLYKILFPRRVEIMEMIKRDHEHYLEFVKMTDEYIDRINKKIEILKQLAKQIEDER